MLRDKFFTPESYQHPAKGHLGLWNLSFWRILQKRNNPEGWDERLRFEMVLALRRE